METSKFVLHTLETPSLHATPATEVVVEAVMVHTAWTTIYSVKVAKYLLGVS